MLNNMVWLNDYSNFFNVKYDFFFEKFNQLVDLLISDVRRHNKLENSSY